MDKNPETQTSGATMGVDASATSPKQILVFSLTEGKGLEQTKKVFKLHKKRAIIGSALSSDVRIQQGSVSNVHAVVEVDDKGQTTIYDMASESGVFINGKKVISQTLQSGDEIKVGQVTLSFAFQALPDVSKALPAKAAYKTAGAQRLYVNEQEDFRPLILEDERNVIEIFDYPQGGQLALQVAQYWDSVILDVRHYAEQKELNLGEDRQADFLVPGFPQSFPFISFDNGECILSFTNDMRGVVRTKQRLATLEAIREERGSGAFRLVLKSTDFVKLQVKGITFFISFTPEPPHLRRQRILDRDPFFMRIWLVSLAMSLALFFAASQVPAPQKLEVAELPPRIATIIFKPASTIPRLRVEEKKEEPPKKLPELTKRPPMEKKPEKTAKIGPKPQPKAKASQPAGGNQGEGKRAAGEEGRKGKANAPKANLGQERSHGNPNAGSAAKSQGTGKGIVESLAGDLSGAISKSLSAGGAGASEAAGRLKGYGAYTTEGAGGLGNLGKGTGGGGESLDVAGLGTKGLGEGSTGKGLGAIGQGGNLAGTGRGRPVIELGGSQDTIILGGLDKDLIDQIIRKHYNQMRYCYEKEINSGKQGLRGRVLTRFVIASSGRVSQSGVESSTIGNANVEKCVTDVLKLIVFPEPLGGGIVEVTYPFNFSPAVQE